MPFWVQGGRHFGALLEALRGAPLRLWTASSDSSSSSSSSSKTCIKQHILSCHV